MAYSNLRRTAFGIEQRLELQKRVLEAMRRFSVVAPTNWMAGIGPTIFEVESSRRDSDEIVRRADVEDA